jgi:Big-like domain-containing protein
MRKFSSVPTRRAAALFSASALAATALIATAGSAGAVITTGGATDPQNRPAFVRDGAGIALALCTDAVQCEPADPADPLHGGYFGAEATAGPITAIYGIETAAGEDPVTGEPSDTATLANVARFRGEGLRPGGRYTIRDPWGTRTVFADGQGDLDVVREAGGEAGSPLGQGIVKTFLRRLNAPAGFIGDLETAGPVTGSPTGFNRITVTGPGVNATQRNFTVNGQMRANTAMTSVGVESVRLGNVNKAGASTVNIPVASFGTAPAQVSVAKAGANPGKFQVTRTATIAQGTNGQILVTYRPQPNRTHSAILVLNDNGLGAPHRVRLQGTGPDTLRARVASSSPRRGQLVGVSKNVSARFNEAVRGVKKSSFTLTNQSNGNKVGGSVSRVGQTNRYVFNPRSNLAGDTTYRVRLVGGKAAIRDLAGNPLRTKAWKFRTR